MDARTMLDRAVQILARQDVDRTLLLFFMNTARRAVVRDKDISRFYQQLSGITPVNGSVDKSALNIKTVKLVEQEDGSGRRPLSKLDNYESARRIYPDFKVKGTPRHYFELGSTLYVVPVPTGGSLSILAEVWPAELTDSATSSDSLTEELPEAWIYLAAAEYLDYFDEPDRGQFWRQKGMTLIDQYLKELNNQYMAGLDTTIRGYYHPPIGLSDY